MPRKVFISFLGFSNYGACYYCKGDYKSAEVRYVQEATLEYLTHQEKWGTDSLALILLTAGAEVKNWEDNGHRDRNTNEVIEQTGLRAQLERMELPFEVRPVRNLPDGNNEQEIWTIFSRIFNEIEEGDELYFDLTHGFRYLPMLALVFGNYAKFLKHTTIRHISYGNFEGRDHNTNTAPLIDLLPLTQLQDWTFAAGQYLNGGNISEIINLSNNETKPLLRNAETRTENVKNVSLFAKFLAASVDDIKGCRGIDVIRATNITRLKQVITNLDNVFIAPLLPIIHKISEDFDAFNEQSDVHNGFNAVTWCLKNELYQQAVTFLQENTISFLCEEEGIDWSVESQRSIIELAIRYFLENTPEEKWAIDPYKKLNDEDKEKKTNLIKRAISNQKLQNFARIIRDIKDMRNDYNHCGMRNNPSKVSAIKTKIQSLNTRVQDSIQSIDKHKLFINLTNHPSDKWSSQQKEAAQEYGDIIDYSFPMIDPDDSEEQIEEHLNNVYNDIFSKYSNDNLTIHIMGEFTLSYALISKFMNRGIPCVASTTERIVHDLGNGKKETEFKFVRFRHYGK